MEDYIVWMDETEMESELAYILVPFYSLHNLSEI